jgi:penicillin amidase
MTDLLRAQIVATIGAERAQLLEPEYLATHPLTIPAGVRYGTDMGADALRLAAAAAPFAGSGEAGQGSNAWVVGGDRSASGRPLLANDPHLLLQIPSLWYENHLSDGDFHVTGASIPGLPCVVIGHNERVAWGLTNGENDVQDLFIERFDPSDPTRYEFQGRWEQATVVREQIVVKGQASPVVEEVRITRHGPVISSLIPDEKRSTVDDRRLDGSGPLSIRPSVAQRGAGAALDRPGAEREHYRRPGAEPRARLAELSRRARGVGGARAELRVRRCGGALRLCARWRAARPRAGRRPAAGAGLDRRL